MNKLPDIYAGVLNTERIAKYRKLQEEYNISESALMNIWSKAIEWYKEVIAVSYPPSPPSQAKVTKIYPDKMRNDFYTIRLNVAGWTFDSIGVWRQREIMDNFLLSVDEFDKLLYK